MSLYREMALAYLRGRVKQTGISILGVALGVGFFIAMAALIQGFHIYFVQMIVDSAPHIVMHDEYRAPPRQPAEILYGENAALAIKGMKPETEIRGIKNAQKITAELSKWPDIAVSPVLEGQIFYRFGSADVSGTLIGIVPERERRVTDIEEDLVEGKLADLSTHANGIIIGSGMAKKLGAKLGDTLTAISTAGIVRKVKVVGIFSTGIVAFDDVISYSLLKKAQVLQDRANIVNSIRMRIKDHDAAQTIASDIEARYLYRTESWQEANEGIFGVFVIQNIVQYSTTSAIMIVACFGIYNIISTLTNEKAKDIAILKSMGFTAGDISRIFLTQGAFVGVVGTIAGWGIGYVLSHALGSIRVNIEAMIRTETMFMNYTFWNYVVAAGFACVASILAAHIPSRRAARLNPVDIIRGAA